MLGQPHTHVQRTKLDVCLTPCTETDSKWIIAKTIKLLRGNIGMNFHDLGEIKPF